MAKVKIYTKPGCPYCKAAKEDFSRRGIDFEEIDVSTDAKALREMEAISGQRAVPVIVEGDDVKVGFGGT